MTVQFSHTPDKKELRIRFDYDPELVLAVKSLPGRKWVSDSKYWSVPINADLGAALEKFCKKADCKMPQSLTEIFENLGGKAKINVEQSMMTDQAAKDLYFIDLPEPVRSALRPFQRAGIDYMARNHKVLLADDMGLGKTIQAIAATELLGGWPALIVCPASLKYNWKREVEKWTPSHEGHIKILGSKNDDLDVQSQVVIVNYDILKKYHSFLCSVPWKTIILDESHNIKNRKAQRTTMALEMIHITKPDNVFLLSGTPVLNRPIELVTQLTALDRLKDFGGFWNFAHRYTGAYKGQWGWVMDGAQNLDDLSAKLRATCFVRREKSEVLTELPEKTRQVVPVEIDNRPLYDKAVKDLFEFIKERGRLSKKFTQSLDGMSEDEKAAAIRDYRNDKAEKAARAQTLVMIETCKQVAGRGKMKAVLDWVDNFLNASPNEKIVIFGVHTDIIEAMREHLEDHGIVPCVLTGDTPAEERERMVQIFQKDAESRVFLANIQAGGVGITLTAASNVLFMEYAWTPGIMDQAEDRCYRMGQKNAVNVYWMSGIDTIDEIIIDRIEAKREVVGQVVGEGTMIDDILNKLQEMTK